MNEESIFLEALQKQTPEERAAFLDRACAHSPELRHSVNLLLKAHDKAGQFLQGIPDTVADHRKEVHEGAGTVIGPYKLLQQIGEGGMGTVYMAEQTEPVRRKVALKVIKPGMDSRQVIARFEAERQALAIMDHINIARVLDAGATESGRPYFVMELVHGVPITKYCDDNRLTPSKRLELFIPVCMAIQHAHQKGVIHRDVKPSNVMITLYDGKPVPKVIDFGVAKATEQRLTERTLFTQYGTVIGTLEYMSPEQAEMSALGIDTRSDVYSLGVLLYELLTGSTPLSHRRLKHEALGEILRIIKEEEPQKPSTRLSESGEEMAQISAQRNTEPVKLTKLMRGELDWIVMRTLEKDRNRRYESASALAADVQRYLADEAVEACPPSASYRLRKFALRNWTALTTGAALAAILILGTVVSIWQAVEANRARRRAEQNFNLARKAVEDTIMKVAEAPRLQEADFHELRRELLASAVPFFEEFVRQQSDDPKLEEERGNAYSRLAYIRAEMGENEPAIRDFEAMRGIFVRLAKAHPEVSSYRANLASSHNNLGITLAALGKQPEAEVEYRAGLKVQEALTAEFPKVPEYRSGLANTRNSLGGLFDELGKGPEAEVEHRAALKLREALTTEFPKVPNYRDELAGSHNNLGKCLTALGMYTEAGVEFSTALKMWEALAVEVPNTPGYRRALAIGHSNVGALLWSMDKLPEAEVEFRAAMKLEETLAAEFPKVPEYRRDLARSHHSLGKHLATLGMYTEAEVLIRADLKLGRALASEFPNLPRYRGDLAASHANLGVLLSELGKLAEAEVEHRAAVKMQETLAAEFPKVPGYRRDLATSHTSFGKLLIRLGKFPEAEVEHRAALKVWSALAAEFPKVPEYRTGLARGHHGFGILLMGLGKLPEAEVEHRADLKLLDALTADFPMILVARRSLAASRNNLWQVLAELGKGPEAEAEYRAALKLQEALAAEVPNVPDDRHRLASSYVGLGILLEELGKRPEAEVEFRAALKLLEALTAEFPKVPEYRGSLALTHLNLGDLLKKLGKRPEAEVEFRAALKMQEALTAEFPKFPNYRFDRAETHNRLGILLFYLGKLPEAEEEYRAALKLKEALAAEFPKVPSYRRDLGGGYCNMGHLVHNGDKPADALAWYAKAIGTLEKTLEQNASDALARQFLANSHEGRAESLDLLGRPAEAMRDWDRAIELKEGPDRNGWRMARAASLVRSGQVIQGLTAAESILKESKLTDYTFYAGASVFSMASAATRADAKKADAYAARAVLMLRQAFSSGHLDVALMKKNKDLEPIRDREDFRQLLGQMKEKKKP